MNKKGFTIVELSVIIVIISILIGIITISLRNVFDASKKEYYKSIENNILLAADEYFRDYRNELPFEDDDVGKVLIKDLVSKRYMEIIKDSKGKECSGGKVLVYRENNNYSYKVCLECDNYKSKDSLCKEE